MVLATELSCLSRILFWSLSGSGERRNFLVEYVLAFALAVLVTAWPMARQKLLAPQCQSGPAICHEACLPKLLVRVRARFLPNTVFSRVAFLHHLFLHLHTQTLVRTLTSPENRYQLIPTQLNSNEKRASRELSLLLLSLLSHLLSRDYLRSSPTFHSHYKTTPCSSSFCRTTNLRQAAFYSVSNPLFHSWDPFGKPLPLFHS